MTETTTVQITPTDRATLERVYGKPAHEAIHKLLLSNCPHPEASRQYTTALIPAPGTDALEEHTLPNRIYGGFHCSACNRYIIPDAEMQS